MFRRFRPYAAAALLVQTLSACSGDDGARNTAAANVTTLSPSPSPAVAAAPVRKGKLVVTFGDSLYAGYGVLPQESFPYELEKALAARGIAATVRNAGVSGDTTAAGRQRLAFTLDGLGRTPDLVIVGLGGNDMLRGIDPAETRRNLAAILTELRRRGIAAMLTGMVAAPNMGADYAARFDAIYPDLADEFDVPLYPFFLDGVVTERTLMLPDRIHPNPRGIDMVVGKVAPLVARRLSG